MSTQNIFSQTKKSNIEQDEKIEKLLLEKRKNNSAITINDKFKIQIFFGNIEESKKILISFKKDFSQTDGTIIFSNPSYKVWVGSFKSKIEAEKAIILIKKKYPTSVIIEPNKK
ncbi:SPOR domain-containing protein [Flavobacterium sp. F372]|uniref:SPOR domain-containing protein n=1 Tax=Flavobacterium bernardetii TaxID=2813823 RepID=A0ABR7IZI0_9FLAO|nr:SPOR domain-containing protein [Flavobacterium bernardetii]NHF70678.1 SPOR domain-containing protein [Flavobacterium bernardetii]